jgi:molybdopterin molybdotransferase
MLAAMGIGRVKVYKPPKICLITVGDELVEVGTPLDPGQIYNSNGILLAARLADYGMKVAKPVAIGDDPAKVALCLEKNLEQADIVLTTGSVSVGDKDVMAEALNILGVSVDIKGLDFKPASAFMTGEYKSKRIFCLSGNPFAALATLELIVRPVLAKFSQQPSLEPKRCLALANEAMPVSRTKVRRFLRGRLSELSGGLRVVKVPLGQSSGRLFSLIGCNCLVDLPKNGPIPSPGTQVKVVDLEITP